MRIDLIIYGVYQRKHRKGKTVYAFKADPTGRYIINGRQYRMYVFDVKNPLKIIYYKLRAKIDNFKNK